MALGRGSLLLVVVVVCFQERGEICVSPCLLPPGKPSVTVGVARRRDAEHPDAQVGGDLEAHACAVAHQIQKREDLKRKNVTSANFKQITSTKGSWLNSFFLHSGIVWSTYDKSVSNLQKAAVHNLSLEYQEEIW